MQNCEAEKDGKTRKQESLVPCSGTDGRESSSYSILEMVEMEGIGSRYGLNYRMWSEVR